MSDTATREQVETTLARAVEQLRAEGDSWWRGVEIAPIAYRRWSTFSRRCKSKHPTEQDRISDLVKGLQAHFEPDVPYTHPNDWRHLGEILANVLQTTTHQVSPSS